MCFDRSGTYLAVAGSDVRVLLCRAWQSLRVLGAHTAAATAVRFGPHASYLASVAMDRTLHIYAPRT